MNNWELKFFKILCVIKSKYEILPKKSDKRCVQGLYIKIYITLPREIKEDLNK